MSKLDSSKEFEDALEKIIMPHGEETALLMPKEALAIIAAHEKATQERVREVLERLKATSFLSTSSFNGMLTPIPMVLVEAIDAELNRVEGDSNE